MESECLKRWMRLGSIERVRATQINHLDVSCDLDRLPPAHVTGRGRQGTALQRYGWYAGPLVLCRRMSGCVGVSLPCQIALFSVGERLESARKARAVQGLASSRARGEEIWPRTASDLPGPSVGDEQTLANPHWPGIVRCSVDRMSALRLSYDVNECL